MAHAAHSRYAQIMQDVEYLVQDHRRHQTPDKPYRSKLKLLVPSVGTFFTPLHLRDAFVWQDQRRHISSRQFVAPSFNDVRLILNTAQIIGLVNDGGVDLITFDGDVTLYDDGQSLTDDNPVIPRLIDLLRRGTRIGIVTAAGYTDAAKYYGRLHGLLDAIANSDLPLTQKKNLIVVGGESNFMFAYDDSPDRLKHIRRREWILEEMQSWTEENIQALLDIAEKALRGCIKSMRLQCEILRKERAVGIVPKSGVKLSREQLEETVLVCQRILVGIFRATLHLDQANQQQETSSVADKLPFCVFNGGADAFVDVGDKSWGVLVCQRYFGGIEGRRSLHVGDQFLSIGANDFKARLACTTAWIASPEETVLLLDELAELGERRQHNHFHRLEDIR